MNKLIFLASVVLFFACEQSGTTEVANTPGAYEGIPAGASKEPYPGNESLVKVTVFNMGGGVTAEGDYYKGIREGIWTEYYDGGLIKSTAGYINGQLQGQLIELDERGQLTSRSSYYMGELHGRYIKYNRTRIKESKEYRNGVLHGLTELYYNDGKLMESSTYVEGLRHGKATWYDQDGNVTIEYMYENGEWLNEDE